MLPVETELHLVLKVSAENGEVNDWAERIGEEKHHMARKLLEAMLWKAQEQGLAAWPAPHPTGFRIRSQQLDASSVPLPRNAACTHT